MDVRNSNFRGSPENCRNDDARKKADAGGGAGDGGEAPWRARLSLLLACAVKHTGQRRASLKDTPGLQLLLHRHCFPPPPPPRNTFLCNQRELPYGSNAIF